MSAKEIGQQLVDLCKQGKNLEAIDALYGKDIVSVEAGAPPGQDRKAEGIDAVLGKSKWWMDNHEIHSAEVKGPFPHGDDKFAVLFNYDVTFKPQDKRFDMEEVAVYTVKDGKIVHEAFFYAMG